MDAITELVTAVVSNVEAHNQYDALFNACRVDLAILTIGINSIVLGFFIINLLSSPDAPVLARQGALLWIKLTIAALSIIAEILNIPSSTLAITQVSHPNVVALSSCGSACAILWIVHHEHARTNASSAALSMWLIISALLNLFQLDGTCSVQVLLSTYLGRSVAFQVALLLLLELPKRPLLNDNIHRAVPLTATCGFLTRSTIRLYQTAIRIPQYMSGAARNEPLNPRFLSRVLLDNFTKEWALNTSKNTKHAFAKTCSRVLFWQFWSIVPLRLLCSFFFILQPLLIRSVLTYVLNIYDVDTSKHIALGLIGTALCIYGGIAISRAFATAASIRFATFLRGILVGAIYKKTLALTSVEAEQQAAATLVSTDIEQLLAGLFIFYDIWSYLFEFSACIFMLAATIGKASCLVILPFLLSHCSGWYIGKMMPPTRVSWNESTESRVAKVYAMLSQIKSIKMVGLDRLILDQLQAAFTLEIKAIRSFRWWSVVLVTTARFCTMITYPLVLGGGVFFSTCTGTLSAIDALTVLSVATLMAESMNFLTGSWSIMISALSCMSRIQDYLLLEEMHTQGQEGLISLQVEHVTEHLRPENEVFNLNSASISMQYMETPILREVTLNIAKGEIVMVVGHTGAGKSTFIRAVIGDALITGGSRYRKPGSIAYCGQSLWLPNQSIRQIITSYSPWDSQWYNDVLDACLLKQDINHLLQSEEAVIGSNGIKLSNGQKQRVALARAIYLKPSIIALDDVFSSLDAATATQLGLRLFGANGLLRRIQSTVFVVTHLSSLLHLADRILLVDVDAHVKDRDSLPDAEFRQKLRSILVDHGTGRQHTLQNNPNDNASNPTLQNSIIQQQINATAALAQLSREEAQGQNSWEVFTFYLRTFNPLEIVLWLIAMSVSSFLEMVPVAYVGLLLEMNSDSSSYVSGLTVLAVSSTVATGLCITAWTLHLVPASITQIHDMLLKTTMDATLSYLSSTDFGSIQNMFCQDMSLVSLPLPSYLLKYIYQFWNVATQIGIIIYFTESRYIIPVIAVFLAALYAVQAFYLHISKELRYLELKTKIPLQQQFLEATSGLEHIRAFGWESFKLDEALTVLDISQRPFYHMQNVRRWLRVSFDAFNMCLGTFLVMEAVCLVHTLPKLHAGVSIATIINLSASLASLLDKWTLIHINLGSVDRMKTFSLQTPREHGIDKPEIELPESWPQSGKLYLQGVSASYDSSLETLSVLKNVSIALPPGRKISITGQTGSGKSSFTLVLLKFLQYSGKIVIDDVDIATIPPSTLRSRITTVSQDSIDFSETIRFNLCPWTVGSSGKERNAQEASVVNMLQALGLWDLARRKGGLDARISELELSPGQKHLLCIARACVHRIQTKSRLVIMDECTSNLDKEAEELAVQLMDLVFTDCTVIQVAHRSAALDDADIILYMENGEIVDKEFREGRRF